MAHVVSPPFGEAMRGRTVLVTGAYGLMGSHLSRALLDRGARVVVLRRVERPASALVVDGTEARCTVVAGDVLDAALIGRVLAEHAIDTVFHLAAQAIVGEANRAPGLTFEVNVAGTWNVLEACRLQGTERVILASSDKAYGESEVLPYVEELPLRPRNPYDASKAAAEIIAGSYVHHFGLPVAITRFANLYGGGDLNPSRLIVETVRAVLEGRRPVVRSAGTSERDFLYVEDAVEAYLAVADLLDAGAGAGEAFNAGGETPHSVLDVVRTICEVAGTELEPEVRGAGTPPGEIDRQWADASKLRRLSGWRPRVSFEEGIGRTLEWYRRHPASLSA